MVVINELITSAHKIYELTQSFIDLDVRQRSILLPFVYESIIESQIDRILGTIDGSKDISIGFDLLCSGYNI